MPADAVPCIDLLCSLLPLCSAARLSSYSQVVLPEDAALYDSCERLLLALALQLA